jgi:hypothetical protein
MFNAEDLISSGIPKLGDVVEPRRKAPAEPPEALVPPNFREIRTEPEPAAEPPAPDVDVQSPAPAQSSNAPPEQEIIPAAPSPLPASPTPKPTTPLPAPSAPKPVNLRLRPPAGISTKRPTTPNPDATESPPAHEFVPPPSPESNTPKPKEIQSASEDTIARQHDRVDMQLNSPVHFSFETPSAPKPSNLPHYGKLLDISKGGCQFEGPLPPMMDPDDLSRGAYITLITCDSVKRELWITL